MPINQNPESDNHDCPIFDERERDSGLITFLSKHNQPHRVETLHKGDFAISDRVAGEIKRIKKPQYKDDRAHNDLVASLHDNRLYEQLEGLTQMYDVSLLIIEMEPGASLYTPFFEEKHWRSLRLSVEIGFNVHIYMTRSHEETVELIYLIWEHEKKGKHYVSPCNKAPRPKSLRDQQKYLLSGLVDVGDEKSEMILDHFKTPIGAFNWISDTEISFTKSGSPRRPKDAPAGFGAKFILKNQKILKGEDD